MCRARAAPASILVPAAESNQDLFRPLLFHVCVFCPNESGCDKQIPAAKNAAAWPPVSHRGVRGQTPIKRPPEKQGLPGRASQAK